MSSRRCPRCGSIYQGEARFCPKDGSPLVEVAQQSPPAPGAKASTSRTEVRRAITPKPGAKLDPAGTLTAQILDGRYEILRKLGEGGMSFVYQAKDLNTGDSVAIKVLSPKLSKDQSSVERLRREAGLAMRLDHPNVCRILRLGETEEGLIYLVMPYLRGELLSDREVRQGPMDPEPGVAILVQVCAGLQHAHELQIIHRDLKPENIMLVPQEDGTERAMIMDFGLAKEKRADPSIAKLTATGIILGTPEFMSPEQIRGRPVDARSDIYALGIVGFELFTGKLPFQGRSAQEMMIARLRGHPTPLRQFRPDFPSRLEGVLMRSMENDPDKRYPDARQFGRALLEAIDSRVPPWVQSLVD
jgi:serine/threonine-protein kinase